MMAKNIRTTLICALAAFAFLTAPGAWQDAAAKKKEPVQQSLPKTPDDLDLIDVGQVVNVLKSDMIKLSNGKTYRLAHIRVPVFHEEQAVAFLKQQTMGKTVGIYTDKKVKAPEKDRYGNLYVNVLREDNTWIQADMIARGMSWAYSTEQTRNLIIPLYTYETLAQKMKVGFWKDPEYATKDKTNLYRYINSYQIYSCLITQVQFLAEKAFFSCDIGKRKDVSYGFNIPNDKIGNFTQHLGRGASAYFFRWRGGLAIIRGWIEKDTTSNPGIVTAVTNLTHPEQIDFIDPATGESTTRYE